MEAFADVVIAELVLAALMLVVHACTPDAAWIGNAAIPLGILAALHTAVLLARWRHWQCVIEKK